METLAPIVLFAYNRPEHLRQTVESLLLNKLSSNSDLYIYSDGPKPGASEKTIKDIAAVRDYIKSISGFKSLSIIESKSNKGLAKSIIEGLSDVLEKHENVIVMEDDIIVSPYFLNFMNDGLKLYKDNDKVISICSWSFFTSPEKTGGDTFFLRFPNSIGWATFRRAWKLFRHDATAAYKELQAQHKLPYFDGDLAAPYFSNMLTDQAEGRVDSWAVRWVATAILSNKLSLYPSMPLSKHIGFGHDATHEIFDTSGGTKMDIKTTAVNVKMQPIVENEAAIKGWRQSHNKLSRFNMFYEFYSHPTNTDSQKYDIYKVLLRLFNEISYYEETGNWGKLKLLFRLMILNRTLFFQSKIQLTI